MKILTGAERESYLIGRPGIGASDVPTILEISPWKSAYELWQLKTGRLEQPPANEAMLAGNKNEPIAIAFAEELLGMKFEQQIIAQHDKYPWAYASADGWNESEHIGLEIKCPRSRMTFDHVEATNKPPNHYYAQMCQQVEIFEPLGWVFMVYHGPDDYLLWEASSNEISQMRGAWQHEYLPVLERFVGAVDADDWPALSGKAAPEDPERFAWFINKYADCKGQIDYFEERKSAAQAELKRMCAAKVVTDGEHKLEWKRWSQRYSVSIECSSAEAAARVMEALAPLSKAAEVKKIEQKFTPESLRFFVS